MAASFIKELLNKPTVPPLENGDRLTRAEFERRYDAMTELKNAELIEGVVHIPSRHGSLLYGVCRSDLIGWLSSYKVHTRGLMAAANTSVRLDGLNEFQPDVLMMIDPMRGGQARISDDDFVEGAPELAAEVASSSVSIDFHAKQAAYQRCGVREYVVWRTRDELLDWFVLRDGVYVPRVPDADGILRSTVFPGLWLDASALLRGDLARVLAVVQQGTASDEHARFVAALGAS